MAVRPMVTGMNGRAVTGSCLMHALLMQGSKLVSDGAEGLLGPLELLSTLTMYLATSVFAY